MRNLIDKNNRSAIEYKRISNANKSYLLRYIRMGLIFLVFQIITFLITMPILVYYGPFKNVRNIIVESSMTSLKHQWIATKFLSQNRINFILNENKTENVAQSNEEELKKQIVIDNNNDDMEIYEIKGKKFKGEVLIVHNPKRIKIGYTKKLGEEGQTTSNIAKEYGAVAAINGGGFLGSTDGIAWTGTGGIPRGIIMCNGKIVYSDINDKNEKFSVMGITNEGYLIVGEHSINELYHLNVIEALSFGPSLIVNGEKSIKNGDGGWGIAPRTAIGQRKDGAIILLVVDGRQAESLGATLKDIQDALYELGAYNATNLDGGFSTTMYYNGKIINKPPDILGERAIPSIVYVVKDE